MDSVGAYREHGDAAGGIVGSANRTHEGRPVPQAALLRLWPTWSDLRALLLGGLLVLLRLLDFFLLRFVTFAHNWTPFGGVGPRSRLTRASVLARIGRSQRPILPGARTKSTRVGGQDFLADNICAESTMARMVNGRRVRHSSMASRRAWRLGASQRIGALFSVTSAKRNVPPGMWARR